MLPTIIEYMFYSITGHEGLVKELVVTGNSLAPFHLDMSWKGSRPLLTKVPSLCVAEGVRWVGWVDVSKSLPKTICL